MAQRQTSFQATTMSTYWHTLYRSLWHVTMSARDILQTDGGKFPSKRQQKRTSKAPGCKMAAARSRGPTPHTRCLGEIIISSNFCHLLLYPFRSQCLQCFFSPTFYFTRTDYFFGRNAISLKSTISLRFESTAYVMLTSLQPTNNGK